MCCSPIEAGVATLTFNRPERLNALNAETMAEVTAVLEQTAGNPEIRVLLMTGQGRAFIAGADINEFLQVRSPDGQTICRYRPGGRRISWSNCPSR